MSELLKTDYHKLVDEFRDLFAETSGEREDLDFVTPALVIRWAQRHDHPSYFLKHNTLVYRGTGS